MSLFMVACHLERDFRVLGSLYSFLGFLEREFCAYGFVWTCLTLLGVGVVFWIS